MKFSKIAAIFIAAIFIFIVTASALSVDDFFAEMSKNKKGIPQVDFQKLTVETPEILISEETKQIAYDEIIQKLEEEKEIPIIVWLNKDYVSEQVLSDLKEFETKYVYNSLNGFAGTASEKEIESLRKDKRVNYFTYDQQVEAHLLQSRVVIQANTVESNYNLRGNGVGVCHLDTGINYNHPYLTQAYAGGYDFVNNDPNPLDDNGHGTATAGVIASNATLFRGIAPNVNLLAVKVLDAGAAGTNSNVIAGIDWCVTNKNTYNISIISMSLGTTSLYTPSTSPGYYDQALQTAYNNNIITVASTGNSGSTTQISYPAVSPFVTSVGATYDANLGGQSFTFGTFTCTDTSTAANMMTCFGNRAPFVDLVAPGASIVTTSMPVGTAPQVGTSVSAPHVSGTIALMKQRNPNLTPSQIENILKSTGLAVYDNTSSLTFKRVNAWNAVNTVPFLNQTGSLIPGGTINLHINDPQNPGSTFIAGISLSNYPGIPLPNGIIIPLNIDDLLLFSIQPNPIISNNIGVLDGNGQAVSTITLPYVPGIQNINVYSAFVTLNNTSGEILSISNSNKL